MTMTSSIVNLLKGPKIRNSGYSQIHADFLPNEVFYHQYNAKTQANFLLMSLKKYQIVRKLPLRFLRNSGSLSNNERFFESFLLKMFKTELLKQPLPFEFSKFSDKARNQLIKKNIWYFLYKEIFSDEKTFFMQYSSLKTQNNQ